MCVTVQYSIDIVEYKFAPFLLCDNVTNMKPKTSHDRTHDRHGVTLTDRQQ
jgi:hypothetical protein